MIFSSLRSLGDTWKIYQIKRCLCFNTSRTQWNERCRYVVFMLKVRAWINSGECFHQDTLDRDIRLTSWHLEIPRQVINLIHFRHIKNTRKMVYPHFANLINRCIWETFLKQQNQTSLSLTVQSIFVDFRFKYRIICLRSNYVLRVKLIPRVSRHFSEISELLKFWILGWISASNFIRKTNWKVSKIWTLKTKF